MNGLRLDLDAVLQNQIVIFLEHKWRNLGLRAKMSALVTIGLAGLFIIFTFLSYNTARQATQQVLEERVMLARMSASNLDSYLAHIESTLHLLAEQPALQVALNSPDNLLDPFSRFSALDHHTYLIDLQKQLVAKNTDIPLPEGWQETRAIRSVLDGASFGVSEILGSDLQTQAFVLAAVPVYEREADTSGLLVTVISLRDPIFFPVEREFDLGASGSLEVMTGSGAVLASNRPVTADETTERNAVVDKLFVAGVPGVETCLGCYGSDPAEVRDEVVAFAPLSRAPWGVVVRQKAEEVFAPVRRLLLVNVILGSTTVLGALVLVLVTTNSVINPVHALTDAAQRIASGDLDTPVALSIHEARRGDEVGALAHSFGRMRRQLKRSMDEIQALNRDLDARVQERTRAAHEAQLEAQAARDDLRAVIDALSDELIVVSLPDNTIQQVNKAALRLHEDAAIIGLPYNQVFPCGRNDVENGCECPIPLVLENQSSVTVTHIHSGPDGSEQQYVDIVASPMRDANGKITRVVMLIRDVSEEKRLKQSLLRRNQQLSILNALATTVNQSLDLEEMLGRALEEVLRLTAVDAGAVFLQEDMIGQLELVAYRGLSEKAASLASKLGMLDGSCGGVLELGQLVLVPDINRYRGKRAKSLRKEKLTSLIHVPLEAKGCTLGSMCVGTRVKHEFSPEEQELLSVIGSQIAASIENARLYAEVQHKEQIRGELFKKVINAQEDERRRIARELHDETSQALTALIFGAEEGLEMDTPADIKECLEGMRDLAQHTLDGVHKLIFDLRPSMLDHLGLVPALRWFADSRLTSQGVRVTLDEVSGPRRLPPEVETALFRVVQEAITNIYRHAAARNVTITFEFNEAVALIEVTDDGMGFNIMEQSLSSETGSGLGLMGMQERLELLGGELEIESVPGEGTQLRIRVPYAEERVLYA